MANQNYNVIVMPYLEKNGIKYECTNYNLSLSDFLNENTGKEIYIYEPSLTTKNIQAIVI
jgi:hypothetical protein